MAQAASKTCEMCMSAAGIQYCLDCEEYYCANCKLLHYRQKLSRTHQFQKATDLIPEGTSKCNEHREELTLMCNTCGVLVCTSCVTGKHNGHTFSKFSGAIAQLRGENETRINSRRREANQHKKNIEQSLIWFDNAVESVIKTITEECTMIKRMVDKSIAEMIAFVKEQSQKEKYKLIQMMSEAESVLDAGLKLDKDRQELDKIKQDRTMIQK
ncbi:TRIM71 [Mytilus edulis]|uniref:TRIM71 n=1 Tax=Mytilus edulis TaxID=6550 RepID=A0A8S3UTA6_MYTED|nr:TRIM71 [Mytilus edulis]